MILSKPEGGNGMKAKDLAEEYLETQSPFLYIQSTPERVLINFLSILIGPFYYKEVSI